MYSLLTANAENVLVTFMCEKLSSILLHTDTKFLLHSFLIHQQSFVNSTQRICNDKTCNYNLHPHGTCFIQSYLFYS